MEKQKLKSIITAKHISLLFLVLTIAPVGMAFADSHGVIRNPAPVPDPEPEPTPEPIPEPDPTPEPTPVPEPEPEPTPVPEPEPEPDTPTALEIENQILKGIIIELQLENAQLNSQINLLNNQIVQMSNDFAFTIMQLNEWFKTQIIVS